MQLQQSCDFCLCQPNYQCRDVGDEMIADSYDLKEVEDAFFFEVEGSVRHQVDAA